MTRQRFKNEFLFWLVRGLGALMGALPLAWARGLGAALGRLFFALVAHERNKALSSLAKAYPGLSGTDRRVLARKSFASLGRGGAEFLRLMGKRGRQERPSWISEVEGWETVQSILDSGRGVVAVTAHFGNWEVLAAEIAVRSRVAVVAQKLYDPRLDEGLNAIRRSMDITIFPRDTSVRPILKWLSQGGVLGVLCDQDTRVDSLTVDFFGLPARTPSGAAWLAMATGAALVTGFIARQPDGRYLVRFGPEIPVPSKESKGDLTPAVQEYARRTEEAIRQYPEQWVWMHERWKSTEKAS
jgi:KDO2-lipid IV(A) lauroyltransferase